MRISTFLSIFLSFFTEIDRHLFISLFGNLLLLECSYANYRRQQHKTRTGYKRRMNTLKRSNHLSSGGSGAGCISSSYG